jgi:hypothetical protein
MTMPASQTLLGEVLQTWVWISLSVLFQTTDLHNTGNVSYAVPGFHGMFTIAAEGVNHTPEFTAGAGSQASYERCLDCAAGMAVVACQMLVDDEFAAQVKEDFQRDA